MSKGCDEAVEEKTRMDRSAFIYRGSNPAVVTDATCYMDWIAEQYQLRLDDDYEFKASCFQSSGDKQDINKDECLTASNDRCDWTQPGYESCRLYTEEGIAKNVFQCIDTKVSAVQSSGSLFANFIFQGRLTTCANNCRGVDPNSIVGAGVVPQFELQLAPLFAMLVGLALIATTGFL